MKPYLISLSIMMAINGVMAEAEPKKLSVGDPDIDGSVIQPYQIRFSLDRYAADGTVTPNGEWSDEVSIVERAGKQMLYRKVVLFDQDGNEVFSRIHLNDPKTLAPKLVHQVGQAGPTFGAHISHVEYEGSSVKFTIFPTPESSPISQELPLSEAPFDLSIYATLLTAFPFKEGYEVRIPVLGPGGQIVWETVRVLGQESVELKDGGSVDSWVLETVMRPWRAWLTKEAPHIVKIRQNFPDGSHQISLPIAH